VLAEQEEERKKLEEAEANKEEGGEAPAEVKMEEPKVERPEPATERVAPKDPNVTNIDNDFKPTILKVWQELSQNYKGQMKVVFRQVRVQRERIVQALSQTQKQYLEFIKRPDTKQDKLDQFIKDFNEFSDQFPDLREDEATKDELHQRVDTLSDELWEIIEDRKEQHIEERKKIMESG
jgi:arsenate reductase-like glutaredoxin family protein